MRKLSAPLKMVTLAILIFMLSIVHSFAYFTSIHTPEIKFENDNFTGHASAYIDLNNDLIIDKNTEKLTTSSPYIDLESKLIILDGTNYDYKYDAVTMQYTSPYVVTYYDCIPFTSTYVYPLPDGIEFKGSIEVDLLYKTTMWVLAQGIDYTINQIANTITFTSLYLPLDDINYRCNIINNHDFMTPVTFNGSVREFNIPATIDKYGSIALVRTSSTGELYIIDPSTYTINLSTLKLSVPTAPAVGTGYIINTLLPQNHIRKFACSLNLTSRIAVRVRTKVQSEWQTIRTYTDGTVVRDITYYDHIASGGSSDLSLFNIADEFKCKLYQGDPSGYYYLLGIGVIGNGIITPGTISTDFLLGGKTIRANTTSRFTERVEIHVSITLDIIQANRYVALWNLPSDFYN